MLSRKLYERFVKDTGLDDDIYKQVFLKFDFSLESLLLELTNVSIKLGNAFEKELTLDLIDRLDCDTFDLVYNVFTGYLIYPHSSVINLTFQDDRNIEMVSVTNGNIVFTDKVKLLKDSGLYKLLFPKTEITNLLTDFYEYFSMFNTYLLPTTKTLPTPIEVLFKSSETHTPPSEQYSLTTKIQQKTSLISGLKEELNVLMLEASSLDKERSLCMMEKTQLESAPERRQKYLQERDLLTIQLQGLNESEKHYLQNIQMLESAINDIDKIFVSLQNPDIRKQYNTNSQELESLKMKKIEAENSVKTLKQSLASIQSQKHSMIEDMKRLDSEIRKIESLDMSSIKQITEKYQTLTEEFSSLQNKIFAIQKQIELEEQELASLTKSSEQLFYQPFLDSKKQDILELLSTSNKPKSITVVENYIKYLFSYEIENKVKEFLNQHYKSHINLELSALYFILRDYCGVVPKYIISPLYLILPEGCKLIKVELE